jgi:hypothetical protein
MVSNLRAHDTEIVGSSHEQIRTLFMARVKLARRAHSAMSSKPIESDVGNCYTSVRLIIYADIAKLNTNIYSKI